MLTIKTKPDCTLGFEKINHNYPHVGWIEPKAKPGRKRLFNTPIVISKISEVTEEQARELVESFYDHYFKDYNPTKSLQYTDNKEMICVYQTGRSSLQSAALSVGIEEKDFDKYLVIKL